ncbi:YaaC family protein [Amycolatopsis sp. cmx-11-12]|uniref:YaaC family protein n=1 Tax=Amycolatopsis sp. cmx-11-12 TaxID=2785795 RepID=UPI00391807F6
MNTWRDLNLPDQATLWRKLRGLRVSPPGAAAKDNGRVATFQAALEQAQQFMLAAEGADYATRPLQLFYALSQGGRAITAASNRLPRSIEIPDRDSPGKMKPHVVSWNSSGHGITAPGISVKKAAKIAIKANWTGLMPEVALAMGVDCLRPEEKISLSEVWPLIPEAYSAPLPKQGLGRALSIGSATILPENGKQLCRVNVGNVPSEVKEAFLSDSNAFNDFLSKYPTLSNVRWPPGPHYEPLFRTGSFSGMSTEVVWEKEEGPIVDATQETHDRLGTRYRTASDFWAFPRVGSMDGPLHPIFAWWSTLFALSMMARYAPAGWYHMTRIDLSDEANAIEHILDEALTVVPNLLLEAIELASR